MESYITSPTTRVPGTPRRKRGETGRRGRTQGWGGGVWSVGRGGRRVFRPTQGRTTGRKTPRTQTILHPGGRRLRGSRREGRAGPTKRRKEVRRTEDGTVGPEVTGVGHVGVGGRVDDWGRDPFCREGLSERVTKRSRSSREKYPRLRKPPYSPGTLCLNPHRQGQTTGSRVALTDPCEWLISLPSPTKVCYLAQTPNSLPTPEPGDSPEKPM